MIGLPVIITTTTKYCGNKEYVVNSLKEKPKLIKKTDQTFEITVPIKCVCENNFIAVILKSIGKIEFTGTYLLFTTFL